jgi:hypothetical protein
MQIRHDRKIHSGSYWDLCPCLLDLQYQLGLDEDEKHIIRCKRGEREQKKTKKDNRNPHAGVSAVYAINSMLFYCHNYFNLNNIVSNLNKK